MRLRIEPFQRRLGSNYTTLLVQYIVNFSLIKQEQRGRERKQKCNTNNLAQFDPGLRRSAQAIVRSMGFGRVYFNRGLQRPYTTKKNDSTGFFVCLLFFLKDIHIS